MISFDWCLVSSVCAQLDAYHHLGSATIVHVGPPTLAHSETLSEFKLFCPQRAPRIPLLILFFRFLTTPHLCSWNRQAAGLTSRYNNRHLRTVTAWCAPTIWATKPLCWSPQMTSPWSCSFDLEQSHFTSNKQSKHICFLPSCRWCFKNQPDAGIYSYFSFSQTRWLSVFFVGWSFTPISRWFRLFFSSIAGSTHPSTVYIFCSTPSPKVAALEVDLVLDHRSWAALGYTHPAQMAGQWWPRQRNLSRQRNESPPESQFVMIWAGDSWRDSWVVSKLKYIMLNNVR